MQACNSNTRCHQHGPCLTEGRDYWVSAIFDQTLSDKCDKIRGRQFSLLSPSASYGNTLSHQSHGLRFGHPICACADGGRWSARGRALLVGGRSKSILVDRCRRYIASVQTHSVHHTDSLSLSHCACDGCMLEMATKWPLTTSRNCQIITRMTIIRPPDV